MRSSIRPILVCLSWLALTVSARGQEVAILQCSYGESEGVHMGVVRLTLSSGSGLSIDHTVRPQLECAETVAKILAAGFELRITHSEYMGLPTYTFVKPGLELNRARGDDVVFIGCRSAWSTSTHVAHFNSSTENAPQTLVGDGSNCAEELSKTMRAGFDLVHGGGGNHSQESLLFTLHAGPRPPLVDSTGLFPGVDVATLTVRCRRTWNREDFVVRFAESSFGGPRIGIGDGTECAEEIALLLEQGFRVLDIRIGEMAESATLTMIRGSRNSGRHGMRPQQGHKPRRFDVAILHCGAGWSADRSTVGVGSVSAGLPPISYGDKCQPRLSELLSSGFEVIDVGDDRFAYVVLYTLARANGRNSSRRR